MKRTEYPWHRCVPGTSFFVPTLDVQRVAFEGLRQGYQILGTKARITARPGKYRGMLGVLFTQAARRGSAAD